MNEWVLKNWSFIFKNGLEWMDFIMTTIITSICIRALHLNPNLMPTSKYIPFRVVNFPTNNRRWSSFCPVIFIMSKRTQLGSYCQVCGHYTWPSLILSGIMHFLLKRHLKRFFLFHHYCRTNTQPPPPCVLRPSASLTAERFQGGVPFAECVITCDRSKSDTNWRKTAKDAGGNAFEVRWPFPRPSLCPI